MAAYVQRSTFAQNTSLNRHHSWGEDLATPAFEQSPHAQLCDVLIQLRDLTLSIGVDILQSNSSTLFVEEHDQSTRPCGSTGPCGQGNSTGLAIIQYETHTPAPLELVKMHNREIKPILDALLPEETKLDGVELLSEKKIQSDFLKLVAYGATNNFAGMSSPAWRPVILHSLRKVLSPIMQNRGSESTLWRTISQLPSLRPMAETHFRCAVEDGDDITVAQILSWPKVNINIDNTTCTVDGLSLTPIEAAASLQNVNLVRILLQHGADVNKVLGKDPLFEECKCALKGGGAVYRACMPYLYYGTREEQHAGFQNINRDLVSLIIDAGGMICSMDLRYMASIGGADLVQLYINAPIPQGCRSLMAAGVLHEAVYQLDLTEQQRLLMSMYDANSGLHYEFKYHPPLGQAQPWIRLHPERKLLDEEIPHPDYLIDIAAQRGQLETVQLLRSWHVPFTESTLVAGMRSLDRKMTQFLLDNGAPTVCFSKTYDTTPFAEAVRVKDLQLVVELSKSYNCIDQLNSESSFCALFAAAAEVGDEVLLDQLLIREWGDFQREKILGYALTRACKNNHLVVTRKLLNSGASTARDHYTNVMDYEGLTETYDGPCPCPLTSAVANRNEVMLELLLDHDAGDRCHNYTHIMRDRWSRPIIEWGSPRLLEKLLSVGFILNDVPCLNMAVQEGNESLVKLLLSRTVTDHIHHLNEFSGDFRGPLETAIRSNNEDMLRLLVESHAARNPASEPGAFAAALKYGPHLYQMLLDKAFSLGMTPSETFDSSKNPFGFVWARAISRHRPDIVHWLVVNGRGSIPYPFTENPLKAAIDKDAYNVLDFFISLGISPDSTVADEHGFTPTRLGRLKDGSREPSWSALNFAIHRKKAGMVKALLEHGADVNLPARYSIKRTPLQQAAGTGHLTIINLLLAAGADIKAPPATRYGGTPIQLAAIEGFVGIVKYLEKQGDDLWLPGSQVGGRTALEGAAEHGRFDMVHYLASRKPPDLDQYDKAKKFAVKNGHDAIADMVETMFQARKAERQPVVHQPSVSSAVVRRRHVCSTCSASFTRGNALRRHERNHQSTYAYRCPECGQGFRRKDTLDRHVESHHVGVTHQCHVCGDEFSRQDTLSQHMRSTHREAGQVVTASRTLPIATLA